VRRPDQHRRGEDEESSSASHGDRSRRTLAAS
jgi:hypothetical protein